MKYESLFDALIDYFPGVAAVDPRTASIMSRRQVSAEWLRGGYTAIDPAGFNPFVGLVFFSRFSCLDELAGESIYEGENTALFLYEVFYALHDYVHVLTLHELARRSEGVSKAWNDIDDIHAAWFRQLLLFSEAAATVAIDYWLLGARPLSEHLDRTGGFQTLTTPYLEAQGARQLAGNRHGINVASPEFMVELARVYCNGWSGALAALSVSFDEPPAWLVREQQQARRQARLAHDWLIVLGATLREEEEATDRTLFEALTPHMFSIAVDLRAQINRGLLATPALCESISGWCNKPSRQQDFRFINAPCWLATGGSARDVTQESKSYFNAQLAARYRPLDLINSGRLQGKQLAQVDPQELLDSLLHLAALPSDEGAPLNLFFVS